MTDKERARDLTTPAEELEALATKDRELRIWVLMNPGAPRELLVKLLSEPFPQEWVSKQPQLRGMRMFQGHKTTIWLNALLVNPSMDFEWLIDATFPLFEKDARNKTIVEAVLAEELKEFGSHHQGGVSEEEKSRFFKVVPRESTLGTAVVNHLEWDPNDQRATSQVDLLKVVFREVYNRAIVKGESTAWATLHALAVQWTVAERWRKALEREPAQEVRYTYLFPDLVAFVTRFLPEGWLP